jgi:hypothetical protein
MLDTQIEYLDAKHSKLWDEHEALDTARCGLEGREALAASLLARDIQTRMDQIEIEDLETMDALAREFPRTRREVNILLRAAEWFAGMATVGETEDETAARDAKISFILSAVLRAAPDLPKASCSIAESHDTSYLLWRAATLNERPALAS